MAQSLLFGVRVSRYYGDHGVWHTVFCSGLESVGTHGVVFCSGLESVGTMVTMEYGTQSSVQG